MHLSEGVFEDGKVSCGNENNRAGPVHNISASKLNIVELKNFGLRAVGR